MGTKQAHKLITVSLEKIAMSRRKRSEMSLHKNLLVTTVIHKAKLAIIKEDRYYSNDYTNYNVTSDISTECTIPVEENYISVPVRDLKRYYGEVNYDSMETSHDQVMAEGNEQELNDETATRMDWVGYEPEVIYHNSNSGVQEDDKENLPNNEFCSDDDDETVDSSFCESSFASYNTKKSRSCNSSDFYRNKRLKTFDPNEMIYDIDQDDNTSHTLRLVSVLSATLSHSNMSSTQSMPTDLCIKQAKDTVDIALLVNRPVVTVAV
ncbi:hypothetical protein CHUAL_000365 [Chamberlinius hualienensis]